MLAVRIGLDAGPALPVEGRVLLARRNAPRAGGTGHGPDAGLAAPAIAASKYGENEGGEFCGRCFVEWSAITVPVGAGVGFTVGYLIDRWRR